MTYFCLRSVNNTAVRFYMLFSVLFAASIVLQAEPSRAADTTEFPGEQPRRFSGREVMLALQRAYPDKIDGVEVIDGDYSVNVQGVRYFWAEGKLLPEELLNRADEYTAHPFYRYPAQLPGPVAPGSVAAGRIREMAAAREENPPRRYPGFYNTLWRISDRASSWARMKTTYFLGHKLEVHRELLEDLAAVEEDIQALSLTDPAVRRFVASLAGLDAYNWRAIAGTGSMSFHSYGVAVDLLPKSYGGKQAYWLWAAANFPEWFTLPYNQRYHPPQGFIEAFEKHGFVWGGKWVYFDTIHFEYRPEIFLLNNLSAP